MTRKPRFIRRLLAGATAAALLAVAIATLTGPGLRVVASLISSTASSTGSVVRVEGLSGVWFGPIRIESLVLEDARGPWFSAAGIELDASRFALLSRRISADRLSVREIELARLPEGDGQQAGSAGLPVDISIGSVEAPDIALGPSIAGGIARIALDGRLSASRAPLAVDAAFNARRTDGGDGQIDVAVDFAPSADRIELKVDAVEEADGVIANLLRLPGAPPVSIAIEGGGPPSQWRAQGAVAVDGQVAARFSALRVRQGETDRIELSGDGAFAPFLPDTVRAIAQGTTEIRVAATLGANGAVAVDRATFASASFAGRASGRYDPAAASDLIVSGAATADPVRIVLAGATVALESAEARIGGTGERPSLDAALSLARVDAGGATLRDVGLDLSSPGFDPRMMTGPAELHFSVGSADAGSETIAALLAGGIAGRAQATLDPQRIEISALSAETDAVAVAGTGFARRDDGSAALSLTATVAPAALPTILRSADGDRSTLAARLERTADGILSLSDVALASGPAQATGAARLVNGLVEATVEGSVSDLAAAGAGISGAGHFSATLRGPVVAPDFELKVESDGIRSAGHAITGLELAASGKADAAAPQASVTLKGAVGDERLEGSASLVSADGRRSVRDLALTLGANRLSGALDLDAAFRPQGRIAFDLPDIAPLAALALQQASGSANGTAEFRVSGGAANAAVSLTSPSVSREGVAVTGLSVEATIDDYLSAPAASGRFAARSVLAGGASITGLDVVLGGDGGWTTFDGRAGVNANPVAAAGRVRLEGGVATVEVARGTAEYAGVSVTLEPSVVRIVDGTARLERVVLGVGRGRVEIAGEAGAALALEARLASVPAASANAFAPGLDATGTVDGTVSVTGPAAAPRVAYTLDWAGAATAQTRAAGLGAVSVSANGAFEGGAVRFEASARDGGGLAMSGRGSLATATRTVSADLSGSVPFAFLTRTLAAQGVSLSGSADVALTVRGSTASPQLGGTIRSSGARFVDARSGIAIEDIDASILVADGRATVERLTGRLPGEGNVSASGSVGTDPGSGFPADLKVSIVNARYADGRAVTANFGGELTVTGPLAGTSMLGGRIALARTVITIPERLPASLSRLNVQHRNADAAVDAQAEALRPSGGGGGGAGGLALDLTVDAPQQIFVQGRGIDAEFGGSIRLTGPVAAPRANGTFTLRRGRFSILGRRLDLSSGTIGFSGSLVPTIAFEATSSVNASTVTVGVSGQATNPQFSFSSSPAAPEDEVLAMLVFGRSLSSLSPLQIAQLAQAAAQLAGIGGSTSLLDDLQGKLGVDDIDVRTDEATGDTSVSVGKYLNDRTYVTIEKGSGAAPGKAAIDLDVGRGVKLRGEATDQGETKGGIFFERDY